MSLFLNNILYKNTVFESYESIKLLEPYMYSPYIDASSEQVITSPLKPGLTQYPANQELTQYPLMPVQSTHKSLQPVRSSLPVNSNMISPKNTDTLFWCMYMATNGYGEYLNIGSKYKNKEIEIKQGMIEVIKKNPSILKSTSRKITNVAIQEIMAELMIDKKTSFKTFFAMCVLNSLNVYIIDTTTKTFLSFRYNNNSVDSYMFYRSIDGFFSVDIEEVGPSKCAELTSNYFELEHGERPIKAISAYKVVELETILQKFGTWSDTKKYKKQDLYDEILTKCIWK